MAQPANARSCAPAFKLPTLDTDWPPHQEEHAELMVQQFAESERQTRENKYYSLWSTAAAFLCSRHSGTLHLENAPVAELLFVTELNPEEVARMKDTDWDVDHFTMKDDSERLSTASDTPGPDIQHLSPNEIHGLRRGLDGNAWVLTTTKEERRIKSAKKPNAVVHQAAPAPAPITPPSHQQTLDDPTPISSSTTATDNAHIVTVRIPRATDGLFLARAKVKAFSQWTRSDSNGEPEVPSIPAATLEVKVPKWGKFHGSENDGKARVQAAVHQNTESVRGSKFPFYIRYGAANKAIIDSFPQIAQQAQLIFHGWKKLDSIWAVGASGRWVRFLKFTREKTPEVKVKDLQGGKYYTGGPLETVDSALFCFINDDGTYTEKFMEYWNNVMRDVEAQYEKCILDNDGGGPAGGE